MANVSITPNSTRIENDPFVIYFVWDEAVTGFAIDDITINAGSKGDFKGSGAVYDLVVTTIQTHPTCLLYTSPSPRD